MSDTLPPFGEAHRRSYFHEAPMEEYTPANSINEHSVHERRRGRLRSWVHRTGKPVLRMANALLHLGLCAVLLAIMVEFILWYRGRTRRPQAIALISLVAVDSFVDIYAVIRLKKKWPGWAMAFRLLLAISYIAQFLVYVGYRNVFPPRYAYWGMAEGYSDPVVYVLLLVLGVWNLLHTAIHRHALGRDLRRLVAHIGAHYGGSSHVSDDSHSAQRRVPSGGPPPATSRPTRVGEGSDFPMAIALSEMHADDKDSGMIAVNRVGASSISAESSVQRGSTVHTRSETVSAATSRRTSAATSDDGTSNADGLADASASVETKL